MKRAQLPTAKCPLCSEKGVIPGPGAGAALRREREERDVARNELAAHFAKVDGPGTYSLSYTLDLEAGQRSLTWALIESYRAAIEKAVKARLSEGVGV